jgi:signal transduction histidine kinase/ActR/RegA family two-component response regulator
VEKEKPEETQLNNSHGTVLVLAPMGQDARLAADALQRAEISAEICQELFEVAQRLTDEANLLLIAEEALSADQLPSLLQRLGDQPPWSDIPVIILSAAGGGDRASTQALEIFGPTANVSLLERPLRSVTLVAAVKSGLRARRRQRQVRDLIIEREAVLRSISRAKVEAEEANRAKDHFLAMLSHELRTPLTPVLMTISAMQSEVGISGRIRSDLEAVRRNIELEALLIDDLLDLTRISHGKLQLHTTATDVHSSIEQALSISASELAQKEISVVKKFAAQRSQSLADATRLEQVFWNIIKNAVKFTPSGGELRIMTQNQNGLEDVVIEFTDTGVGIEAELQPRIFDAFEQGSRAVTNRYGGLGLGLAICKRVIEMHGGKISVHSAGRNRGATFTIVLKTVETPSTKDAARPIQRTSPIESADILLVEDHADSAEVIRRMLEKEGYRVTHAPDVASAQKLAQRRRFQLLISDLGLPDGNGLELMRELRNSHRLQGIALSGYGMESDVTAAKEAGFTEHLTKPVDWERLRQTVEHLLASRGGDKSETTTAPVA